MKKANSFRESFCYAWRGFRHCLTHERNFRVHTVMGLIALCLGLLLKLSAGEMAVLLLVIAAVLCAEMVNTAFENLVDLCTETFHPLAKTAKDVAAGAVLIFCFFAVLIGIVLFVPRILSLFM